MRRKTPHRSDASHIGDRTAPNEKPPLSGAGLPDGGSRYVCRLTSMPKAACEAGALPVGRIAFSLPLD
jgi:hypothetical protein